MISFFGCIPYFHSGAIPRFVDAFFETVSGFTTTGASILSDIEALPKALLFWRSLTHWIGGIGIIVLVIVIMPSFKLGGYQLFTLESSLQERIQPKVKSVGLRLLIIYLALTFLETFFLLLGGMDFFHSICHSFGTVATGGFSPKNTSIAEYSPYIQYVIMIFMFLAGLNFVVYYYLFKMSFNKLYKNEEIRFYFIMTVIIGLVLTGGIYFQMHKPFEESFRDAFFQIVSIITCTGFATTDYLLWPQFAWVLILFSMFLGGCTGSTSGGIKMARHLLLLKNVKRRLKSLMSRNAVIPIRLNGNLIKENINRSILTFIVVYLFICLLSSSILLILGIDGHTSISAVATCMAGIGPGIGTVGPVSNFGHLPDIAKYILSINMLLGRLEIYSLLIIFTPVFWKK
ncbi:MAG: TrkH family potassium uptake protein [Bacteroidales bacterium]|nr:TrkH family potassium uptake protein [Bacteroidales bacterium]